MISKLEPALSWIIASVFIVIFAPAWAFFAWVGVQFVMNIIVHIRDMEDQKVSTLKFYILCAAVGFPLFFILKVFK